MYVLMVNNFVRLFRRKLKRTNIAALLTGLLLLCFHNKAIFSSIV